MNMRTCHMAPQEGLDKSILDLRAHAESGAGPDSAPTYHALACLIREPAIRGRRKLRIVQSFPKSRADRAAPGCHVPSSAPYARVPFASIPFN